MIFSQYGYKNFHNENKDDHPIQPWTIEGWCKMVNDNQSYCQKMNWLKWIEFYFWFLMGRFTYSDLPSFHAYWTLQIKKDMKVKLRDLEIKYIDCKKSPKKIKYYFNQNASLVSIKNDILKLKQKIDSL